jgi:hypothetical protein
LNIIFDASHYRAKLLKCKFVAILQNLNAAHLNLTLFRKVELTIRERAAHSHSPEKVSLATESLWKQKT